MSFAKLLSGRVAKVTGSNLSSDRYEYIQVNETEPDFGVPLSDNGIFSSRLNGERRFLFPSTGLIVDNITGNITVDFTTGNDGFSSIEVTDTDSGYTWTETGIVSATGNADTVKFVSGNQIDIDADDASKAILISHANTSNLSGTYGSSGISNITVDENGHITEVTTTVFNNYNWSISDGVTTQEITSGETLTVVDGIDIDAVITATDTLTINNTSTLDSITGRGNTTTNGIEVGSVKVDSGYVFDGLQTTIAATTQTALNLFGFTTYGGAKILIQASDTVTGERQMSELLLVTDGVTAKATEFGIIFTGASLLSTFDVDLGGGNLRLLISGSSSNSTEYKITVIKLLI